ncbi:Limonene 1,2-monooxygenase [bacterium HR24]|nr:Limonene 1,2-monooxygenase [bacterium HR24]
MDKGIGLPATIPGTDGETVIRWAEAADRGPFSTLGIIDRLCYPNQEALMALAAAAAVTRRVKIMPTVLVAPLREPVLLAKQVATLDVLSGGRVVLGLGVGARPDDFVATGQDFRSRGRRLETMLETMRRLWRGEPVGEQAGPVGPRPVQPGGPRVFLGGFAPAVLERAARIADGIIINPGGYPYAKEMAETVRRRWQELGRPGQPSFKAAFYYALGGPEAQERGAGYLRDYYAFLGPNVDVVVRGMLATPEAVRGVLGPLEEAGYDEVFFWPTVPDLAQVERLTEALG